MNTVDEVLVHFLAGKAAVPAVYVVNEPLDELDCCARFSSRTTSVDPLFLRNVVQVVFTRMYVSVKASGKVQLENFRASAAILKCMVSSGSSFHKKQEKKRKIELTGYTMCVRPP